MFNIFDLFNKYKITLNRDEMFVVLNALSCYNRELCDYYNELAHSVTDYPGDEYLTLIEHTWKQLDISINLLIELQNKLKFRGINYED